MILPNRWKKMFQTTNHYIIIHPYSIHSLQAADHEWMASAEVPRAPSSAVRVASSSKSWGPQVCG